MSLRVSSMVNMITARVSFGAVLLGLVCAAVDRKDWHRVLSSPNIPVTSFTCEGRPVGYYADVEAKCQVYHMCGDGGRQFSYLCPDTTLFQQRMLVCAHWYQVNCSRSHEYYRANLLIGQKDTPFVGDEPINSGKQVYRLKDTEELQQLGRTPHRRGFTELPTGATSGSARGTRTWSSSGKETPYQSPYIRTEPTGTVEETYRKSTEIHNRRSWPTFQVGSPPRDQYTTGASEQRAREVTTEPSPGSRLRPTYVSFRSTIETPRIDPPAALTVPMTPSSSGGTTPTSRLEGPPTIQLRLQDPRRTLYIPERGSFPPPEEDIVIRIALKGKPRGVPCSNCDRLFANCSPCVLDQ